jgi:hypothetical protein
MAARSRRPAWLRGLRNAPGHSAARLQDAALSVGPPAPPPVPDVVEEVATGLNLRR